MNKQEILKEVSRSTGFSEEKVTLIFDEIIQEIKEGLKEDQLIDIDNFGSFKLNIKDNLEADKIDEKLDTELTFTPSKNLINF